MVKRCSDLGMNSIAITDHGSLYGAIEFYSECLNTNIKPILGCEVYVAKSSHTGRLPSDRNPYHLTLLAKNATGYRNLLQLVTKSHLDGFYYRPRIDRDLLTQHQQGIIALSGCLNGELANLITDGASEEAEKSARWFREVFDQDYYIELQRHTNMPQLDKVNDTLLTIAKRAGIPLVATNDLHYVNESDSPLQDLRICISTNSTIKDETRLKMEGSSFYLKSPTEMEHLFSDLPDAITNTQKIADACEVKLDFTKIHLPSFPTPTGTDAQSYLESLCYTGLGQRRPGAPEKYLRRLEHELEVVRETQFANYFLVVWDITSFARQQGILFGVRGSAAASLVLFSLGVTDIDPLEYELVFERFLNIERKEMPDIDMDFQDDRREEVIQHTIKKYGPDHVAQIITFGTLGPRAAIRDVGRALAIPYPEVDRVARLVPARARSLSEVMETTTELPQLRQTDPEIERLLATAQRMEGMVHHASTHAAGVVITSDPLTEYVPLQRTIRNETSGTSMTQYSMEPIAKLGLLKMDFLGLANLTILDQATKLVEQRHGISLDLQQIPLDDETTFRLLASGETTDVFQLEGAGMRRYIKELNPTNLRDIAAMVALYRPGPMEHIDTYIRAKNGTIEVSYPHLEFKELLEETYGVIVYQDQVLHIAQRFAGYTLGQADIFRKAMGKKVPEIMIQERDRFIEGSLNRGYTRQEAESIFQLIEPFAGYAFNKAHAVSYALIAYWTAYFKANYPVEYMTSVLATRQGNTEKTAATVAECYRLGIPILPPDVGSSNMSFSIEGSSDERPAIRFGLAAVKNVGELAANPIVSERSERGHFKNVEDFCQRIDLRSTNRRTLESLIKVGALDCLLEDRAVLLASLDQIISLGQQEARRREAGQSTMFDLFGDEVNTPLPALQLTPSKPVSQREKMLWERELLGVDFGDSPFIELIAEADRSKAILSALDLDSDSEGKRVTLVGQVNSIRQGSTRRGQPFMSATIALMDGTIEVMAWSDLLATTRSVLVEGNILWIIGKLRTHNARVSIHCEEIHSYDAIENMVSNSEVEAPSFSTENSAPLKSLSLTLEETTDPKADEEMLRGIMRLLMEFPGKDSVRLDVQTDTKVVRLDPAITTTICQELIEKLTTLLGAGTVMETSVSS